MKDFDAFSFRANSDKKSSSSHPKQQLQQPSKIYFQPKNWRQMSYRFQKNEKTQHNKMPTYESFCINQKWNKIDEELTQNIKRRIQLQKKLYQEKQLFREKQNDRFFKENFNKNDQQATQTFVNIEKKSQAIDKMLSNDHNRSSKQKRQVNFGEQKILKYQKQSQKIKQNKKCVIPDQLKIQKLLKLATFPSLPQCNLQKLQQQCYQLLITTQHSDLWYIMIVISFHLSKYHNVRKYFRQIQMFKVFEVKAYWIACQTQFQLQSYSTCLILAQKCMNLISDVHLPRFIYLQAKSYQKLGNFINSIVCYNQVIKMQPKIPQLYLQRAMIYDKIGYPLYAKQDYQKFNELQPKAREIIKQKILCQKNEIKKKQMIKALAKIN